MERASRALCAASVWAACLFPGTRALAADSPRAAKPTAPASQAHADTQPGPEQAAAAAYQRALSAYEQGDVAAALVAMRESYELSRRAELFYNLARLEDELKDCQAALKDYGRYLEQVPRGQYREAATQASELLARTCQVSDGTKAPPAASPVEVPAPVAAPMPVLIEARPALPPATPPPARYWTATRYVGWSAIAAGTIAGAGSLYFRVAAVKAHESLQRSVDAGPPYETRYQTQQDHDQEAFAVLAITGGALVASGALLLILDADHPDSGRSSASFYVQPGVFGATVWQRF